MSTYIFPPHLQNKMKKQFRILIDNCNNIHNNNTDIQQCITLASNHIQEHLDMQKALLNIEPSIITDPFGTQPKGRKQLFDPSKSLFENYRNLITSRQTQRVGVEILEQLRALETVSRSQDGGIEIINLKNTASELVHKIFKTRAARRIDGFRINNALQTLRDLDLVICEKHITEFDKKRCFYDITPKGLNFLQSIKK